MANPFGSPTRTPKTELTYLHEGERHLRRARRLFPAIRCPANALLRAYREKPLLKASSTRRYKAEHLTILDRLLDDGEISPSRYTKAKKGITKVLILCRGLPSPRRTGAKKVRDLMVPEYALLLDALAARTRHARADCIDHYLWHYATLAPVIGIRPCEAVGMRLSGDVLTVPCAKHTNGRAGQEARRVPAAVLGADLHRIVGEFLTVQRAAILLKGGFDDLYATAAERLARTSVKCIGRRICPYSFRHVALATWKAAGYDAELIARLAGHSSQSTAAKHYAGRSKGWPAHFALAPDTAARMLLEAAGMAAQMVTPLPSKPSHDHPDPHVTVHSPHSGAKNEPTDARFPAVELDSIPQPKEKPALSRSLVDASALWHAWGAGLGACREQHRIGLRPESDGAIERRSSGPHGNVRGPTRHAEQEPQDTPIKPPGWPG